jgi:hypothetical protein
MKMNEKFFVSMVVALLTKLISLGTFGLILKKLKVHLSQLV